MNCHSQVIIYPQRTVHLLLVDHRHQREEPVIIYRVCVLQDLKNTLPLLVTCDQGSDFERCFEQTIFLCLRGAME